MQNALVPSKIRVIYIAMFCLAALLLLFALRWQVVEGARFSSIAASRDKDAVIPAIRGTIYAADGSTLAYSEPRYNVYVYMPELEFAEQKGLQSRDEFAGKVAPVVDKTPEQLAKVISDQNSQGVLWIKIADSITLDQRQQILGFRRDKDKALAAKDQGAMLGYFFSYTSVRIYPEHRLASQLLGLAQLTDTGKTVGQGGLEGAWDGNLEPLVGFISGEQDAKGNAVGTATEKTIEAKRGSSIYTTIDKKLQSIAEDKLKWGVQNFGADTGSIVIMDPKTGAIMAMANYPDYDPNIREEKDPNVYGDMAISQPYEIGSVGKIFTLAAAVDMGAVTPDSVIIQGHDGCESISKDLPPVCTHDHLPQPPMAIKDAFALSDNIYFLHLAQLMPKADFQSYLQKFGIGKSTGVDLAGESYGILKDWHQWNIADQSAYSYGHSYEVNTVQAADGVSAVANFGVRMQPHLVSKVVDSEGKEVVFKNIPLEQVIKKSTTLQMDEMMHVIYENNMFYWEHEYDPIRSCDIAMKSGTALIPDGHGGYSNDYNATYVGYDASPDRSFVMVVRLHKPTTGDLASYNSRILWLQTFLAFKDYLGVRCDLNGVTQSYSTNPNI